MYCGQWGHLVNAMRRERTSQDVQYQGLLPEYLDVHSGFVRKTFEQFLWNGTQNFLPLRNIFARKQHFAQFSAKVNLLKISLYRICATLFCAIAFEQFRYFSIFIQLMVCFLGNKNQPTTLPVFLGLTDVRLFISNF